MEGDHSFLEDVRDTASYVGSKVREVVEQAAHTLIPGHHDRRSKISRLQIPHNSVRKSSLSASCTSSMQMSPCGSMQLPEGDHSHSPSVMVPDIILDSNAAQPIMCTQTSPASHDSGESHASHDRFSCAVVEAEPRHPAGDPAMLAVQEYSDVEN